MQSKLYTSKGIHTLAESLTRLYTPRHIAVPTAFVHPHSPLSMRSLYNDRRHDTMRYRYAQDAIYLNPLRIPPSPSSDQVDNEYQGRRSNIPDQQNNCSNNIQHHALQDQ